MRYRDDVKPASLEEAWQLNQKKSNRIIGGTLWMRLASYSFATAIDLSGLGLDKIEAVGDEIRIGAMISLHDIEKSELLNDLFFGAPHDAVSSIVGVQFRNGATVGGSVFGRFGFSDVLTLFMALDAQVELYKAGRMGICEFASGSWSGDILTYIYLPAKPRKIIYLSQRNTRTDFPVLTCAVSEIGGKLYATVGARPMKAVRMALPETDDISEICEFVKGAAVYGSNMRASAEYRQHIAGVLAKRGVEAIRRL